MAIVVKEPESNSNFTPIETGTYQSVCAEVIDMGMRESNTFDKKGVINGTTEKQKVSIVWELSEVRDDGKRYTFSKEYTSSLHEKAGLRKDLDSWRGVPFTPEELQGFDLERVVGANCMITISAYAKQNGHEGRKITGVSKLMKGLEKMDVSAEYERPKWINEALGNVAATGEDGLPF